MTKQAQDIMSRELFSVTPDMSLIEMDKALAKRKISGAPVVKQGELVGIVTRTDVSQKFSSNLESEVGQASYYWHSDGTLTDLMIGANNNDSSIVDKIRDCSVEDIMTNTVISISPTDDLKMVAGLMVKYKIHRILVVDDKKPVGLITSLDMVGVLAE